jgi:hypothetical protein
MSIALAARMSTWSLRRLVLSALSLPLMLGARCGGLIAPIDAGTADDAPSNATDAGTSCNGVMQQGSTVQIVAQSSDPPTGTWGGDIEPGTYVLTSFTKFTGSGGASGPAGSLALTIQISSLRFDAVYTDGASETRVSYSGAVSEDGGIVLTPLCPAPGTTITGTYSLTNGQLVLQVTSETPPSSEAFMRVE